MFLVSKSRQDEGQALVMVLTMMVLLGSIIAIIAMMSVFGIGFTSQTRASAQSIAAAEAGLDEVAASILNDACLGEEVDGTPAYEAKVEFKSKAGGDFTPGCPSPGDYAFRITSTGYAAQPGGRGYDLGDTETLEAVWQYVEQAEAFNSAIHGDTLIYFHSNTSINAMETDGDIFTRGDMVCASGMHIGGSVVVGGDVNWTGSNCLVDGSLYVRGNLIYPVPPYGSPSVGGNVYVLKNIQSSAGQSSFGFYNANQMINTSKIIRAGERIHAYCAYPGRAENTDWSGYSGSGSSCGGDGSTGRVQMHVSGLEQEFPEQGTFPPIRLSSSPWSTWDNRQWSDYAGNALQGNRCESRNGGSRTVMDITVDTRVDLTDICSGGLLLGGWNGGLTINLGADLIIYAKQIDYNGNVTISSVDGQEHSVYFVTPVPESTSDELICPDPAHSPAIPTKITMQSGSWDQDEKTAVLFYTDGGIASSFYNWTFGGQLYGCAVDTGPALNVEFRKVGAVNDDQSAENFRLQYVRPGSE